MSLQNDPKSSTGFSFQAFANDLIGKVGNKIGYFHDRWQDERLYEDWADYEKAMREIEELQEFEIVKVSKRPFGVTIKYGDWLLTLYATKRYVSWKAKIGSSQIKQ